MLQGRPPRGGITAWFGVERGQTLLIIKINVVKTTRCHPCRDQGYLSLCRVCKTPSNPTMSPSGSTAALFQRLTPFRV